MSKKRVGRHRKQAARHRKRAANNGRRAAQNGIVAAAVGLGLAVGVGHGVAAASTDGGSSDSGSASHSASNGGSNSSQASGPKRTNGSAGSARTRSTGKAPAADSNGGSSVTVRSVGSARIPTATATPLPTESSTTTTTSTDTTTTTGVSDTTDDVDSATDGTSTTTTTTPIRKAAAARSVAPSAAAYSMQGDGAAVQAAAGPITTPAQYDIQTTLDAWGAQLNAFLAAPATAANAWLKVPVVIGSQFFTSSLTADRFSYQMNGLAALLNQFVPPFKMVDGAPETITQASVTAAVLAGAIEVFNITQDWDYVKWGNAAMSLGAAMMALAQGDLINGLDDPITSAASGAFLSPKTVLDKTIDLGKPVNPVSFIMYIAVVAIFERFAEVAIDHQPVVTDMQQTSQHLPNGSGTTVSGYVQFYDADGDPITSYGFTEPNDSRFTVTVVDGTNGRMDWTVWDWNPLSSDKSPKTLTFTMTVLAQGDGQISVSKPYMPNGNETTKTVTVTVYYNQAVGSLTNTVGSTSAMGVVRGTVSAPNNPDNPMTYSLVGASGGSAYTANGGIIKLNPTTGAYTYVPNRSSSATTDSFQLTSTDSFGHTYTTTVSVPVSSASPVTTTNPTTGTVTGSLNNGSDAGLLTYSIGTAPNPLRGTVILNANGTFTYTRTAAGHTQPTQDSFTILGTDSSGKTTTIAVVNVNPTVSNSAPVGNGVTVASSALSRIVGPYDRQDTSGTLKATDAEGDPLTWAAGTYNTAQGGTITVNANGTFTYTNQKYAWFGVSDSYWHDHAADGDPGDTFTIAVSDAFGGTTNVTYGIPIEKQNAAPTLSGSVSSSNTDGLGVVRGSIAGGSDDDGDGLTYGLVNATGGSVYSANGGIVSMSGTSFTYVPKVGVTSDSFQVQVNDGHGGTTTATVTLTGLTTPSPVTNVNTSTPNVVTGQLNTTGNTAGWTYSLGVDGTKVGTPTVVSSTGAFTYTRNAALGHSTSGADSFTIVATETATGRTVTIATINVTPSVPDIAPTASLTTAPTEGSLSGTVQTSTGKITANDADGDTLTYTASGLASGASVTFQSDGSFTYTTDISTADRHAAAKYGATAAQKNQTFTVTVSDGYLGGTTSVLVTVPIYAVNTPPVISKTKAALTYTIKITDAQDTIPTTKNPATGQAGYSLSNGGTLTGILSVGVLYTTTSTITVTAWDGYYVVDNNGHVTTTLSSTTV